MQPNAWSRSLSVTADGTGGVAWAGSGAVRLLADQVGLTGQLSTALARRRFLPVHTRGQVLVDLATVLAAVVRRLPTSTRCGTIRCGVRRLPGHGVANLGGGHPGRAGSDRQGTGQGPPTRVGSVSRRAAGRPVAAGISRTRW